MLGRYTTGPVAARPDYSRGDRPCPTSRLYSPTMPERPIDLRSDTVSRPTDAMRKAMAEAEVGDDVFGDDPTVTALEERAAELLGKEAGLFVASGTMGNLTAMMAHLGRGQEVIAGAQHHLVIDEAAGHAVIVGASARSLEDRPDGTLDPAAIDAAFRDPTDPHEPLSGLITLENTHAHSMAQPLTPAYTREVAAIARRHGVPLHIDGARFWNSVVAQRPAGVTARDLADPADTVTFCLSKGLGCPVGSVLVGYERGHRSRAPRAQARRRRDAPGRRARGGRPRRAGRWSGRHDRPACGRPRQCPALAEALSDMDGIVSPGGTAQPASGRLDPGRVATNFVLFKVDRDRAAFLDALRARNVLMVEYAHGQVRAVTHHDISTDDIETAIRATREALTETEPTTASRHRPTVATA